MLVTHTNFRSGTGGTGDEAPQLRDHNFPCEFDLNYHELTAEEKHQQKKAFKAVASQLGLSNFGFDSESKDPPPLPAVSSSDKKDPKDNLEGQDVSASITAGTPLVLDPQMTTTAKALALLLPIQISPVHRYPRTQFRLTREKGLSLAALIDVKRSQDYSMT